MGVEIIVCWCFFLLSEKVFAWSSLMEFEVPMLQVVPVCNNGSQPLQCTFVPATTLNWTTVSRISWVVNIDSDKEEEKAVPSVNATLLDPAPPHQVTCRVVSYDPQHRRTFTLISPSQTKRRSSKPGTGLPHATLEIVEGGSIAEAKTVKASVGEVLRMRCQAINLPNAWTHVQIYMHLVQSSEDGVIETELNAVHPFGSRQELDTFVLLSEQDNHKRFYCQARWMERNSSIYIRSVRSPPWRLTIEPGLCSSVSSELCVGLLVAGWALAALVLVGAGVTVWCVWCRRRRSESRRSQITSTTSDVSRRVSAPAYEIPTLKSSKPDTVNITPDPKNTNRSKGRVTQGMPPHHAPSHRMPPYSAGSSHEMPPHIAALHNAASHRNIGMDLSRNAAAMSRHRLPSESTVYENPDQVVYSNTLNLSFKMPERPMRY